MEKWSFNRLLFSRLSDVLDISGTEIAKRCEITQQVLSRYTTNEIVVSVQTLIKICNALRMPIHFFVSEDDNHIIPNRESATVAADRWCPVTWDSQAVEQTFGDGRIFWKDVAKAMGITSQKPHERFLLRTRFPVTDFLSTCSHFGISPFTFLVDNNRYNKQKANTPAVPEDDDATLRAQIKALQKKVERLSTTVDDLTTRYRALLDRHDLLEQTVRQHIGYSPIDLADDDRKP